MNQIKYGMFGIIALLAAPGALASGPASANYAIAWEVIDGGGGIAASANYTVADSIAQPTATGTGTSVSYVLASGFHTPPDFDADQVKNFMDNCIFESNTDQRDSNGDGFGNICDQDLNGDLSINPLDLGLFKNVFFTADPDADFNGDGVVNPVDLGILKARFFGVPGPSGIAP